MTKKYLVIKNYHHLLKEMNSLGARLTTSCWDTKSFHQCQWKNLKVEFYLFGDARTIGTIALVYTFIKQSSSATPGFIQASHTRQRKIHQFQDPNWLQQSWLQILLKIYKIHYLTSRSQQYMVRSIALVAW